jgi:branched-chain amino acid transport system ATP-binding protein
MRNALQTWSPAPNRGNRRRYNGEGIVVLLVEQNGAAALTVAARAYILEEGWIVAEGVPDALFPQLAIRGAYLSVGVPI